MLLKTKRITHLKKGGVFPLDLSKGTYHSSGVQAVSAPSASQRTAPDLRYSDNITNGRLQVRIVAKDAIRRITKHPGGSSSQAA